MARQNWVTFYVIPDSVFYGWFEAAPCAPLTALAVHRMTVPKLDPLLFEASFRPVLGLTV